MQNAQVPHPFLLMPHRLFLDAPMPAGAAAQGGEHALPLAWPCGHQSPASTQCKRLVVLPNNTTSPDSHTRPAQAVEKLSDLGQQLKVVRRCAELNNRLFNYADPNGPGVQPNPRQQYQMDLYRNIYGGDWNPNSPGMTTAGPGGLGMSYPYPSGQTQYDRAKRLAGWFIMHAFGDEVEQVQSEVSIQDQVRKQLFLPAELLLQTRYNFSTPTTGVSEPGVVRSVPAGANFLGPQPAAVNVVTAFPRFGRATHAMHSEGNIPRDPDDPESEAHYASGFPDFMLFSEYLTIRQATQGAGGRRHGYNFCVEVKSSWTLPDDAYANIFDDRIAHRDTGIFDWMAKRNILRPTRLLLKQIWGEAIFFRCNWGMSTNGSTVIFFVKLNEETLVFGEPMNWTDVRLLQTLLGICFASVDENRRGSDLRRWMCYDTEWQ